MRIYTQICVFVFLGVQAWFREEMKFWFTDVDTHLSEDLREAGTRHFPAISDLWGVGAGNLGGEGELAHLQVDLVSREYFQKNTNFNK